MQRKDTKNSQYLFVLVDERTASAAEQIAYLLQNHERATIIGSKTYGAAHGSVDVPLAFGIIGYIPLAYEVHLKSGRDWEGIGVIPDILIDKALEMVLELN